MFSFLLDLLFPPRCLHCAKYLDRGVLCAECAQGISLHANLFCGSCGARMPGFTRHCHLGHPYVLAAASDYSEPAVQALVRGLKFQGIRDAVLPLARILTDYAEKVALPPADGTLVVPVPLSARRLRERGFNQSELLAEALAQKFGLEKVAGLTRPRHAPPQSGLASRAERERNVSDAFQAEGMVRDRDVWLVDDVATSGSTLREAAGALRRAGAKKITAWVVAKA